MEWENVIRKFKDIASAYDVVVLGAGAAGMAAALFAAISGKKVLLVERTELIGGTTALSAGTAWLPGTPQGAAVNPKDTPAKALRFLDAVVGKNAPRPLRKAFIDAAPQAVATLAANSDVHFRAYATHPDYEQDAPEATLRGRALEPLPFNGRELGQALRLVRKPIPEFTIFDGMMVDRNDINHLLGLGKKLTSFIHATKILTRYGLDRVLGQKRGTRLLMGNALVARLLKSLLDRKVDIILSTDTLAIKPTQSVTLEHDKARRAIGAKSIVLAGGGFGRDAKRRAQLMPKPVPQHSPAAPGHTGALQALAMKLGARFVKGADVSYWTPVSIRRRSDGSLAVFPHFVLDRSKPGTLCVDQTGRRFTNESASYHRFGRAMLAGRKTNPCWIITDSEGLRRYGLGMVRVGTRDLSPFIAEGYLLAAQDIASLARKMGVEAKILNSTIARLNGFVRSGIDSDFKRGTTAYHRVNGDVSRGLKNPTLAEIEKPPFFAVKLHVGDLGAAAGLATSIDGEVLGKRGAIKGLYAVGNDALSVMGGIYPAPGITIGPALAFAYRAVQHMARKQND